MEFSISMCLETSRKLFKGCVLFEWLYWGEKNMKDKTLKELYASKKKKKRLIFPYFVSSKHLKEEIFKVDT